MLLSRTLRYNELEALPMLVFIAMLDLDTL